MSGQWVVTYRIQSAVSSDTLITEFYRGERAECIRICEHFSVGEDDCHQTRQPWKPIAGPAECWDQMVLNYVEPESFDSTMAR